MAKIWQRPPILLAETSVCRFSVRDFTVKFLFVPIGMGSVESEVGGIRGFGLRPGCHSQRNPVAIPLRRAMGRDIPHGGGERCGKPRENPGTRGSYQSYSHSEKAAGAIRERSPAIQRSNVAR